MRMAVLLVAALVAITASAARLFVAASSMSGSSTALSGAPLSEPLTMAAWVMATATNANFTVLSVQSNAASGVAGRRQITLLGSSGFSGQLSADAFDSGTRMLSSAVSTGTWYHVAAVFVGSTERYLYLNGVCQATNTSAPSTSFSGHRLNLGMRFDGTVFGSFADGRLAEACLWNVALSAGQISSLAAGKDPRTVSATAPVVYWPVFGEASPEPPYVSANTLTITNSPAKADHPPVARQ